jgi:hypothetical protein
MLVLAGTLAFVVTNRDEDGQAATPGTGDGWRSNDGTREAGNSVAWSQKSQAGDFRSSPSGKPDRPGRITVGPDHHPAGGQARLRTDLKVQVEPGHPRHEELLANASRVETSALRHLEQLTNDLDLTTEQQSRIFPILVRGSQSYEPGMQIVDGRGSNGTATPVSEDVAAAEPLAPERQQELIEEELDPRQADALVNLSIRDLMIWEELIGDLTKQLDQATPGQVAEVTPVPAPQPGSTGGTPPGTPAAEAPAAGNEAPTLPESNGGENIFDLFPAE